MSSLDQQRAALAYQELAGADSNTFDAARRLPDLLRINGLLAAWAYLLAKPDQVGRLPEVALAGLRLRPELDVPAEGTPLEVFKSWVGTQQRPGVEGSALRELAAEALAFSGWLKRAAEALGES